MKKVSSWVLVLSLMVGVIATPATAGSHESSSEEGYYKKIIIKKTRTIHKSCTGCYVSWPCCSVGRGYRPAYIGRYSRFAGTPLQFRGGQPIRNTLRVPARLTVRAAGLVGGVLRGVGRLFFPRRFY
ncbi:MAG: hypothetical protein EBQ85_08505 [Proteobacteria bacterium]|nr:hypothetical protein [Pseudomonadota bacterium]